MPNETMYCVKCRKKVSVPDATVKVMKRGRSKVAMKAWAGTCPTCGTNVYKFIGKA